MRTQVESSKLHRDDRQALNIILSRCYLEGYGADPDPEMSAHYLRKAALAGSNTARGLTQAFHNILGVPLPPDVPIMDWLVAATKTGFFAASRKVRRLQFLLCQDHVVCDINNKLTGQ